jgi:hypothetical protein
MWEFLTRAFGRTLSGFAERLAAFGPNLLAMAVTLVVGIVLAGVLHVLLKRVFPRLGVDRGAERAGVTAVLEKGGIASQPSHVLAALIAWAVLGVFVLLAIGALDIEIAMGLVSQTFAYLPQLLIGLAILILGGLVAAFVRRSVLIASVNAGLPHARFLAGSTQVALMTLFATMALEHLGVGRQVILIAFAILFGGVVLALALAFGLAGRDLAREFMDRAAREWRDRGDDVSRHL